MPNLYMPRCHKEIFSWFWDDILGQEIFSIRDTYIQYYQELIIVVGLLVLLYCMMKKIQLYINGD